RRERRFPRAREAIERARLGRQPVGRWVEMVRVRDLAGASATPVLLLVDVPKQRAGVRRAWNDADLGKASEVLVLVHAAPPGGRLYATARAARVAAGRGRNGPAETCVMIMTDGRGDSVSEASRGGWRSVRARRGSPLRSARGPRRQRTLRERGDPRPHPLAHSAVGLSVHGRRAGRGGVARAPRGRRPQPPPAL